MKLLDISVGLLTFCILFKGSFKKLKEVHLGPVPGCHFPILKMNILKKSLSLLYFNCIAFLVELQDSLTCHRKTVVNNTLNDGCTTSFCFILRVLV